jgi:hypothetical protein
MQVQAGDAFEWSRKLGEHLGSHREVLWGEEIGVGAEAGVELFKFQFTPIGIGECREDSEPEVLKVILKLFRLNARH